MTDLISRNPDDTITIHPANPVKLGDTYDHNGLKLTVDKEFTQGADAKGSGYKYFMNSPKGVYGLKEV